QPLAGSLDEHLRRSADRLSRLAGNLSRLCPQRARRGPGARPFLSRIHRRARNLSRSGWRDAPPLRPLAVVPDHGSRAGRGAAGISKRHSDARRRWVLAFRDVADFGPRPGDVSETAARLFYAPEIARGRLERAVAR